MRASGERPPGALLIVALLAVAGLAVLAEREPGAGSRPPASPSPASASPSVTDDAEREARLRALPYSAFATGEDDRPRAGVTRYVRGAASEGLNLFPLASRGEAWLVDMTGKRLHAWASARGQPDADEEVPPHFRGWQDVEVDAEGALYALVSRDRVLKLDSSSRLAWEAPLRAHHDLTLAADGSVYTLTDELRVVEDDRARRRLVFDNDVVRIGPGGAVRSRISMLDVLLADAELGPRVRTSVSRRFASLDARGVSAALDDLAARDGRARRRRSELEHALGPDPAAPPDREMIALLRDVPGSPSDVLHGNAVRVLDRAVPGLGQAGDLLVSLRDLDLVAVLDPATRRLRWRWGPGVVEWQHDPSVTPNRNLLIFDNGARRGASRVLEVEPASGRVVWSQGGFFSLTRGASQALSNGNVLIVESDRGRAFETTRAGDVVWEFFQPDAAGGRRRSLSQMHRITGEEAARLRRRLGGELTVAIPGLMP
jgi:Arylsulfotransferase (ASST)